MGNKTEQLDGKVKKADDRLKLQTDQRKPKTEFVYTNPGYKSDILYHMREKLSEIFQQKEHEAK